MKTNIDRFYKVDKEMAKEGVWFDINEDIGFLVSHYAPENHSLRSAVSKDMKPYIRQIQNETLDPEKELALSVKVFVKGCVKDWKGITDEKTGESIPFTTEAAIDLLTGMPELYRQLEEYARNVKHYLPELGNS